MAMYYIDFSRIYDVANYMTVTGDHITGCRSWNKNQNVQREAFQNSALCHPSLLISGRHSPKAAHFAYTKTKTADIKD